MRQTSVEAFHTIRDNGLLSKRRWQVYEYVYTFGPCSAGDAVQALSKTGIGHSSVTPRFAELQELGLFTDVGTKKDPKTQQTVIVWDVTDKLPLKFEKPQKEKCNACNGKGYIISQQAKFNL